MTNCSVVSWVGSGTDKGYGESKELGINYGLVLIIMCQY